MRQNFVETLIGAVVVGVAILFLLFAFQRGENVQLSGGYKLTARVTNATGISTGTDVRIAGVKVGTVSAVTLDPKTYEAVIALSIAPTYELPEDSSMSVASESLLGGNFISLAPGGDFESVLKDGDEILFATGTVDIMSLIQQAIFGTGGASNTANDASSESGSSGDVLDTGF